VADRVSEGNAVEGLFPMNASWRGRYRSESETEGVVRHDQN
jgi:5-oxopent-3-ene-1,2,5-tricarboxylate decarboxylase/2-hydroxyhepta-2,4-diene-1,7-dioate isomerase